MKKLIILLGCVTVFGVLVRILYGTGIGNYILLFLDEYVVYIDGDIEHKAKLFESIIGGMCSGAMTFGALLITILHEKKKDREFWKRERNKDKEERLLSVRPFLNIEIKSVSGIRNGRFDEDSDYIIVGQGTKYQYAHVSLANHGYGKCRKIMLDGRECSVKQLDKEQEEELDIYFKGIVDNDGDLNFEMFFVYDDIFGNKYLQKFRCCLRCECKELKVEIGEPLLGKEEA